MNTGIQALIKTSSNIVVLNLIGFTEINGKSFI